MSLLIGVLMVCVIPIGLTLLILFISVVIGVITAIVEIVLSPFIFILSLFKRRDKKGV